MSENIRIWEAQGKSLKEIPRTPLDLEIRLEEWIANDISLISSDYLVIGRQVQTAFGGVIDLLCLDSNGDIVVIELKKDKTPREVVAQVLDYASWVNDLSREDILAISERNLKGERLLDQAFKDRFEADLPEVLNESHKMLIVASEIDDSTERIIHYLSDQHGISINTVFFQYFKDEKGRELLARTFLIEPDEVESKFRSRGSSKRKPPLSFDEFREIAKDNGVGELFDLVFPRFDSIFDKRTTTLSTVSWAGNMEGRMNTILNLLPEKSSDKEGLHFYVYIQRLESYLKADSQRLQELFPANAKLNRTWNVNTPAVFGYFLDKEEAAKFADGLEALAKKGRVNR